MPGLERIRLGPFYVEGRWEFGGVVVGTHESRI